MSENPDAEWVHRLRALIRGRSNILALVTGHLHRHVMTTWAGTRLAVCPSTAPQVALDLAVIDPDRPDGRPMIVADPPAYALQAGRVLLYPTSSLSLSSHTRDEGCCRAHEPH
jgi:hypothetical protein